MRRVLVAILAAAAVLPAPASASFPGRNGVFALVEGNCTIADDTRFIHLLSPSGREGDDLTPRCEYFGDPDDENTRSTHSPDWSPDGSRMLYLDDGAPNAPTTFMTVRPDGTDVRAVGPAPPDAGDPSFAPDGRRFVYATEERLYVDPGDGGPATVLRADAASLDLPVWSPDGTTIAVRRSGSRSKRGIWLLDASTGRFLRRVAQGAPEGFDWSPDARRIVVATASDHGENGKVRGANLVIVRAGGKGRARLFVRTRRVAAGNPVWSPDGKSIAWIQTRFTAGDVGFRVIPALMRKGVKGGSAKRIARLDEPFVEEGYYNAPDIAWQPLPRR